MSEQEDFLSSKHTRMLNIASWAKYFAWVVLIVFAIWAVSEFFAEMNIANGQFSSMGGSIVDFARLMKQYPV